MAKATYGRIEAVLSLALIVGVLMGMGACVVGDTTGNGPPADFSGGRIWIGATATGCETQAAKEIQRYLYAISGKKLAIETLSGDLPSDHPAIVVGTLMSLPEIARACPEQVAHLKKGTNEAFNLQIGGGRAVILANEPIGALYGAYTFLEKFGIGFYLGGDALPGTKVKLQAAEVDELWSPAFPIRGCVIWYNFLNGPVCWDIEDYRYFFDQMVKMKANLVSFPEYGHGLTDYVVDGKLVPGVPFPTSMNYGWGTVRDMKCAEFGFGTGQFFTGPAYGSKASVDAKDDQDAIARSQVLFAQACEYAKQRGIKVSLGFQLDGPPDEAHVKDVSERLRVLTTKYPWVEYVWFWQNEGGATAWGAAPLDPAQAEAVKGYATHFTYLNDAKRANEGGRMASYITQSYNALKAIAPEKKVVISGWGGDKWLQFTDLFVGLDEILPKDIVFSALDNIDPSWEPNVSQYYGKMPDDRERWAIPWWESDGGGSRHDQFFNECNTKPFSLLLPDVVKKGCKGVLGIHWRSREVEDVAAYMNNFAWNPKGITYESFWLDFARRCFGPDDAPEMAKLLMQLDALGPRWAGGGGQVECGAFCWELDNVMPKAENLQTMQEVRQKLVAVLDRDRKAGKTQFTDRLERVINSIDWATLYDDAAVKILQASTLDDKQAASKLLMSAPLAKAMQTYTHLLYTQSDWGVLATVNVKAYASLEQIYHDRVGEPLPRTDVYAALPFQVAFKNPNMILPAGKAIPVQAIVTGDKDVRSVKVYYRTMAEGKYVSLPMTRGYGNVYAGEIPASAVTEAGVEYYIEAKTTTGETIRVPNGLPSVTVTVVRP